MLRFRWRTDGSIFERDDDKVEAAPESLTRKERISSGERHETDRKEGENSDETQVFAIHSPLLPESVAQHFPVDSSAENALYTIFADHGLAKRGRFDSLGT
jgi:hypothetical protein